MFKDSASGSFRRRKVGGEGSVLYTTVLYSHWLGGGGGDTGSSQCDCALGGFNFILFLEFQ